MNPFLNPSSALGGGVCRNAVCRLGLALLLLALLAACSRDQAKSKTAPPLLVSAEQAKVMDVPQTIKAIGHVEALNSINVRSQVTGYLQKTHISDGDYVKQGQRLFTIDPEPYRAKVREAESNLARDRSMAEQADRDYLRYKELIRQQVVSQDDFEQYRTNAIKTKDQVKADEASLATAKLNLGFCFIDAPLNGVLGYTTIDQGNLVTANTDTLVNITQVQPIYVRFSVPEAELPRIRRYMQGAKLAAEVRFEENAAEPSAVGELTAINNVVDVQSGMILLQAEFKNKDLALWPGQFVNVSLTLSIEPNQVVAPSSALMTRQDQFMAFVVKPDMTVELRNLTPGVRFGKLTVIKQGINPGELVVNEGLVRLYPGANVELREAAKESGAKQGQGS